MNARLLVTLLLALGCLACGGAAASGGGAAQVQAPVLDPKPPLVDLVGADASVLGWLNMGVLRASPRYGVVLSVFDRALPDDYPSREYAHAFADRTETGMLALVDRGDRRVSFLYLLRGRYGDDDLEGLVGDQDPFVEETYGMHLVRTRGEVGATLLWDHTWIFGSVGLVHEALDRYDGAAPRGQASPLLLDTAARMGVDQVAASVVVRPSASLRSLLGEIAPERSDLFDRIVSGGLTLDAADGIAVRALAVTDGAEAVEALRQAVEGVLGRYRHHPGLMALGVAGAADQARVLVEGNDLRFEAGLTSEQLDTLLGRLRFLGMMN